MSDIGDGGDDTEEELVYELTESETERSSKAEVKRILGAGDHYSVLDLDPTVDLNANEDLLRRSYLEKSILVSPINCSSRFSEKAFSRLVEAYDTLCDPIKRARYDGYIGKRVRRRKNSNTFGKKLNRAADTLAQITQEQELKPVNTPLRTIARGLLWLDKGINSVSTPRNRRRRRGSSDIGRPGSEYSDSEDSRNDDNDTERLSREAHRNVLPDRRGIAAERSSRLVIQDGSALRRLAQGFSNMDTVVSSYLALVKEGAKAHREHARRVREQQQQQSNTLENPMFEGSLRRHSTRNRRFPFRGLRIPSDNDQPRRSESEDNNASTSEGGNRNDLDS
mmetsp:Transcript_1262/g.1490  ORF Transcript_1262/g.1490 Transcript_1262/m.1490 type:complete len:337 (+) Transcript_1262:163-1173(+)